jgi:hypothetical protein
MGVVNNNTRFFTNQQVIRDILKRLEIQEQKHNASIGYRGNQPINLINASDIKISH